MWLDGPWRGVRSVGVIHNYTWSLRYFPSGNMETAVREETKTQNHDCGKPSVESVSAYLDEGDLVLVIDGSESRLPGGAVSANLTDEGDVEIFIRAAFVASMADLSSVAPGS